MCPKMNVHCRDVDKFIAWGSRCQQLDRHTVSTKDILRDSTRGALCPLMHLLLALSPSPGIEITIGGGHGVKGFLFGGLYLGIKLLSVCW